MSQLLERFLSEHEGVEDCWLWTGANNGKGYGIVGIKRRPRYVHRVVYERLVGPIPEGLEMDHLCRNRACANPDHLEPVTHVVNAHRGVGSTWQVNLAKTHCKWGHEFTPENTRRYRNGRWCIACETDRTARRREQRRELRRAYLGKM